MNNFTNSLLLTSTLIVATACSGGGGGNGGQQQPGAPIASATLSTLLADRLMAPADGTTEVTLSMIARSTANQSLGNRPVRFEASAGVLQQPQQLTNAQGAASTTLTNSTPGVVTVTASVDPDGNRVELQAPLQITFTPVDAPVLTGVARYRDVDGSASLTQGDELVLGFSVPVDVSGATPADLILPVTGDTFGSGASLSNSATNDREVVVTLGIDPVLRSRGRYLTAQNETGSPSAVDVAPGSAIRSASTATPAMSAGPADVVPAFVDTASAIAAGERVAAGDTSNDNLDDVVVASGTEVREFVSNGDGSFTPGGTAQVTNQIQALAAADLNNFTRAELVVGTSNGTQVFNSTQAGNGPSIFSTGAFLTSGDTSAVAVGDVDNDGFPDIVTGGPNGAAAWLHQRNLGNSFAFANGAVGSNVLSLQLADLDHDGNLDLVLGTSSSVELFRGQGNGQFVAAGSLPQGGQDVAVADFNGDTRLDIASTDGAQIEIVLGQGAFAFASASPVAIAASQLLAVDIDGDSYADLVASTGGIVRQLQNDRNGGFEDAGYAAGTGSQLATLDFDGDGDLDIATVSITDAKTLRNSQAGSRGLTRFDREQNLGADTGLCQAFGDLNGDGIEDRLLGTSGGAQIWLGTGGASGAATFQFSASSTTQLGSDDVRAVALADLDADGDLDAVLGAFNNSNSVWLNNGSGAFTQLQTLGGGAATQSVCVLDFQNDGDLDIVFGNDGLNSVYTSEMVGGVLTLTPFNGAFTASSNTILIRDTIAVLARDVDNDGDDDIVVVNRGTVQSPQDSYLFKQTIVSGVAQFSVNQTFNAQLMSPAATLGDINNDGFVDLVLTRVSPLGNATVQHYRGQRTTIGNLPVNIAGAAQIEAVTVAVADLNGDNVADLVLGERNGGATLMIADGQGNFASSQLTTSVLGQLSPLDIDRDGDLDLITAEAGIDRVIENR
tara:strand:- start:9 stop:2867 length:2859 start_codon:yes stop_codon:yes gene_type:complete